MGYCPNSVVTKGARQGWAQARGAGARSSRRAGARSARSNKHMGVRSAHGTGLGAPVHTWVCSAGPGWVFCAL